MRNTKSFEKIIIPSKYCNMPVYVFMCPTNLTSQHQSSQANNSCCNWNTFPNSIKTLLNHSSSVSFSLSLYLHISLNHFAQSTGFFLFLWCSWKIPSVLVIIVFGVLYSGHVPISTKRPIGPYIVSCLSGWCRFTHTNTHTLFYANTQPE